MPQAMRDLIEAWEGLAVVSRFDSASGAWIFICFHDTTLGPATGGTRMRIYPRPEDGLLDAMRLSAGMTAKWAAVDLDFGGGKAVVALAEPLAGEAREALLRRYGDLVESLSGGFITGEDMGTSSQDMLVIAERTRFVHGFDPETGSKVDPSPYTARGVFSGIKAALGEAYDNVELPGRRVLVEGVGNVGEQLARFLAEGGATVLLSDLDNGKAVRLASEIGGEAVPGDGVAGFPCDVYSPCAVGATLNRHSIPNLACRIVAGSANNQLQEPEDAARLADREILYVPDYIINAGGALSFALLGRGIKSHDDLLRRMDGIGYSVSEILRESSEQNESPVITAQRRVTRALERARTNPRARRLEPPRLQERD